MAGEVTSRVCGLTDFRGSGEGQGAALQGTLEAELVGPFAHHLCCPSLGLASLPGGRPLQRQQAERTGMHSPHSRASQSSMAFLREQGRSLLLLKLSLPSSHSFLQKTEGLDGILPRESIFQADFHKYAKDSQSPQKMNAKTRCKLSCFSDLLHLGWYVIVFIRRRVDK